MRKDIRTRVPQDMLVCDDELCHRQSVKYTNCYHGPSVLAILFGQSFTTLPSEISNVDQFFRPNSIFVIFRVFDIIHTIIIVLEIVIIIIPTVDSTPPTGKNIRGRGSRFFGDWTIANVVINTNGSSSGLFTTIGIRNGTA
jgi:hypothetical protein